LLQDRSRGACGAASNKLGEFSARGAVCHRVRRPSIVNIMQMSDTRVALAWEVIRSVLDNEGWAAADITKGSFERSSPRP
jgi:hypothetical protein